MYYRITTMLSLALLATTCSTVQADFMFRGLPLYQQGNELNSPVLNKALPFAVDMFDDFNRQGPVGNSVIDGHRIGFVPPFAPVPNGPLSGSAANVHGRWMPALETEYITEQGRLRRQTGNGVAMACLPWRVFPTLGDDYLIQMTANVAEGEEVRLGYIGDVATYGNAQGLAGRLGQLVFGLERKSDTDNDPNTSAEDLVWTIEWDVAGNRQFVSGQATAGVGEELNMQLGWLDENMSGQSDRFDAWLATSQGNRRLTNGNMNPGGFAPIDPFGVGIEILGITADGTGSYIGSFTAAVPEPAPAITLALGAICAAIVRVRRGRK